MEGKLALTPLKLLRLADEESQILKHSNQWVETIDPSISTLQAFVTEKATTSNDLLCTLTANLGFHVHSRSPRTTPPSMFYDGLEWRSFKGGSFYDAPSDLTTPRYYDGRFWYFCTKCGRNGRWVCTHRDDTHKDNYTMASPYPSSMEANTMRQHERDNRGRPRDYDMYHTRDRSRSPCYRPHTPDHYRHT
jgi:hypothetical protein